MFENYLIGIFVAFLAALFFSIVDLVNKKVVIDMKTIPSILYIVFFNVVFSIFFLLLKDEFVLISLRQFFIFLFTGMVGFIAFYFFLESFRKNSVGITVAISNSYPIFILIFSYFLLNDFLKPVLLIPLFIIIFSIYLSVDFKLNFKKRFIVFPLITSIGWGFFSTMNAYFLKIEKMSVYNIVFYLESFVFLIALLAFLCYKKKDFSGLKKNLKKNIFWTSCASFGLIISQLLLTYSFSLIDVSIASSIAISSVIIASIGSYFVFKENMSKNQKISIILVLFAIILYYVL